MANQKTKKGGGKGGAPGSFPVKAVIVTLIVIAVGIGAGLLIWSGGGSGDDGGATLETGIALPSFVLDTGSARTKKAYQVALTIPDDLKQIPCYCGCSAVGHTSNLDCFIKERNGDNVIFDDHGAG